MKPSALIALAIWAPGLLSAVSPGPERVMVIVNDESALSRRIGEMYARRRNIPTAQVCRIHAVDREVITRAEYDQQIEPAVMRCLRTHKLTEQIFYLVIAQGVPLRVKTASGQETTVDGASVDSELTLLYRRMRGEKITVVGPVENPFFRQRDAPFDHRAFPIYLVTRLAAYSYEQVARLVDLSLAARNQGKVVIDMRSNSDEDGNSWLRNAAMQLPADRVVFDETATVMTKVRDAIGYASWGSNDRNHRQRFLDFRWLPGALATEFVSTDGRTFERPPENWKIGSWQFPSSWFKDSPQSLTADYIEEGATGASGHVDEPYLQYCPRPELLFPAYLSGRNLAESFWLAIPALSWMNIVIGDPLCRLAP